MSLVIAPSPEPTPVTASYSELLAENARLREHAARVERENAELWRVMKNGRVLPQKRCTWTSMLRALYEERDAAGNDTFITDYYDLAIKAGMFQRPKSDDPEVRREETQRARDKVRHAMDELHNNGFIFKGDVAKEQQEDGRYEVQGVKTSVHGNLIGSLHRLSTYNAEIPVREKRGPQSPRAQCGHCGSFNVTYDCHDCGAINQPIESAEIVMVPDHLLPPDGKISRQVESISGRLILPSGDDVDTEERDPELSRGFQRPEPGSPMACPTCYGALDELPTGGYICDPCGSVIHPGGYDG